MDNEVREVTQTPKATALRIAACFILVGSIYILVSDLLIMQPYIKYEWQRVFQIAKGLGFIFAMGISLYVVLLGFLRKMNNMLRDQMQTNIALKTALERFPGPSAILDNNRNIEFINAYALRLLGKTQTGVMGLTGADLFPADRSQQYLEYMDAAYETGEPAGGEVVVGLGRERRYFMVTFVPIHSEDNTKRVIALAYDVSDRKRSSIRMEQQKRELRQIIDLIPNFIFAKDDHGRYIMANEAFCRFHGLTPEQIMGKTINDILPDASMAPEIMEQDRDVMKRGVTVYRANQQMPDHHGQMRMFQITKIPFRTTTGNKAALLGVALDITERIQNEKAINKSQNRFRALVDHSLDALFVYDGTGELTLVNERACELLGKTRYDLVGQNFMEALMGNKLPISGTTQLPIFYAGTCFQLVLAGPGGKQVPVEVRIGPLPGDDDGAFLAEVRDISERLQVEQERQLLSRLGVGLSATRNPGEIAHALFDAIGSFLLIDAFFFAIRVSGKSRFRHKLIVDRVNGELQYFPSFDYEVRPDTPLIDVYNGQPRLLLRHSEETSTDGRRFSNFGNSTKVSKSLMYFPVHVGDKVIAIMSVQSYHENAYTHEHLQIVQRMADMAAPALESAQANQQKSLFAELGRQLGAARTADDVAQVVAQLADDLTGWDSCIIGLYSKDDDNITYIYLADELNGERQRIYEPHPFRKPRLLAERVLKEGPFLVLREERDNSGTYVPPGRNAQPSLSMIWVPIPGENGPTGFISLQSYAHNAYDQDDLETTRALADHCGAALNRTGSQELLRYREERYRLAIESTGAVTYQLDYIHQEYIFMGKQIEEITGYPAEEITKELWESIILELNVDPGCEITRDSEGRKYFKQWRSEMRIRHRNGEERWLSDQAVQLHNSGGTPVGTLGIIRDITEQKRVELALRASEERYALSARGANDGLWDWDLKTNRIHFSERWTQMLGFNRGEPFSTPEEWYRQIHPEDLETMKRLLKEHLMGITRHFECETRTLHRNGSYRWMLIRGIAVRDDAGNPTRIAGSQTDVTDRVLTQERLLHDALHDPLTGLPNRALLMEHLERCLEHTRRRTGYRFAVVFMDLDRFKMINDSLGHLVGDHVLVTVAQRLRTTIRPTDFVARFAGDEFAMVLEQYNNDSEIVEVVGRVQSVVSQPIVIEHHEIITSTSAGVAVGSPDYMNPSDLLRDADNALYRSKADGAGHFRIFDSSMHDHAVKALRLEADLRKALERDQMIIDYQPIISVSDGNVQRFEALLRWQHPEMGLLGPDEFMPLAEETGLVFMLDEWVISQSCRWIKSWNIELGVDMDNSPMKVNVNLSPRHFLRPLNLAERLSSLLEEEGVQAYRFGLEITENALLSFHDETTVAMHDLKKAGFSLYLDDFGKGYSSLSYLHNFPFNVVKIDRLFMMRIQNDGPEREIVHAILSLAAKLNLGVVAEGVETAHQMEIVKDLGCDCVQGYYISRPVSPEKALQMVAEEQTW